MSANSWSHSHRGFAQGFTRYALREQAEAGTICVILLRGGGAAADLTIDERPGQHFQAGSTLLPMRQETRLMPRAPLSRLDLLP